MRNIAGLINKLRKLAEDQKGKPEGDVAAKTLKELCEKYPEYVVDDKLIQWQTELKDTYEFDLWVMSCKAHNIKGIKINAQNNLKIISEGYEIDMIMARNEWEFATDEFAKISIQVMRGIVNKIWPQICTDAADSPEHKQSEYEDFATKTMNRVRPFNRKALKGGKK